MASSKKEIPVVMEELRELASQWEVMRTKNRQLEELVEDQRLQLERKDQQIAQVGRCLGLSSGRYPTNLCSALAGTYLGLAQAGTFLGSAQAGTWAQLRQVPYLLGLSSGRYLLGLSSGGCLGPWAQVRQVLGLS